MRKIFLYVLDGKPYAAPYLHFAQSAIEDNLLFKSGSGVSEVEWGETGVERYGATLWLHRLKAGVEDSEKTGQIIFPVNLPEKTLSKIGPSAARFTVKIETPEKTEEFSHEVPAEDWHGPAWRRAHALWGFVSQTAFNLGVRWSNEEGS